MNMKIAMKIAYWGFDGREYTAEYRSHPIGHLQIIDVLLDKVVREPIVSENEAQSFFLNLPGASNIITYLHP